ncbi:MAG TPA: SMP-30/gluconolactonase/LRE family protein [Anseongella sp.]
MFPLSIEQVSIFAEGLDHPECMAYHPDGSVWAGGEAGQIYRISSDGSTVEEIARTGGFVQGVAISPGARWLAACDPGNRCVWKLDLDTGKLEKFATGAAGQGFNIPNYAAFDASGRLYVSESGNFRRVNGKLFRFAPDGDGEIWHEGPFNFANGLALSKNETHLYVACTWLPGVERIVIRDDGSAGEREVYVTLPKTCPDGLAFDRDDNLYISCYAPNAVFQVNTRRDVQLVVDDWEAHTLSNPTNIAFGGDDFRQLFVANLGRWHISRVSMPVQGLPLVCQW